MIAYTPLAFPRRSAENFTHKSTAKKVNKAVNAAGGRA
jgi:hypothetical protein